MAPHPSSSEENTARRLARLAAIQGLYQIALTGEPVETIVRHFCENPAVLLQEERSVTEVDSDLFSQIVRGVSDHQSELDNLMAGAMGEGLSASRLEPLLKSILRAGIFEIYHHNKIAVGIIVNDYIDVTHSFFNAKEPGLVNAILDQVAKKIRS